MYKVLKLYNVLLLIKMQYYNFEGFYRGFSGTHIFNYRWSMELVCQSINFLSQKLKNGIPKLKIKL